MTSLSHAERHGVVAALRSHLPSAQVTQDHKRSDPLVVMVRPELVEDDASMAQVHALEVCRQGIKDAGLACRATAITEVRAEPPVDQRKGVESQP